MLTIRHGDLFAQPDLDALAHGCNTQGVMGSGIAVAFREKFPRMHAIYTEQCELWVFGGGSVLLTREDDGTFVFCLGTQILTGRNAKYELIENAATRMMEQARRLGFKKIGIPAIGCGIGGLEWDTVKMILETVSEAYETELVACLL